MDKTRMMNLFLSLSVFHFATMPCFSYNPTIGIIDEKVRPPPAPLPPIQDYLTQLLAQAFHLEVVGGLMHVLAPYAATTTVYLHPLNFPVRPPSVVIDFAAVDILLSWPHACMHMQDRPVDFGFVDIIKRQKSVQIRGLPVLSMPHHDILIFVSPEYRIDYVREFIERSQPKAVIALIHNGDAEGVMHMRQLHPNVHLFTLSPHVAK
jgi:hypothetical protein